MRDLFIAETSPKTFLPPQKSQFCCRFCMGLCILQLIIETGRKQLSIYRIDGRKKLEKDRKSGTLGSEKGINMFD